MEIVESCNKNNCLNTKTKLVIVGTITPPDGAGYFYTAPRNKIYGYIDYAINTNLKELKKQFINLKKIKNLKTVPLSKNYIVYFYLIAQ